MLRTHPAIALFAVLLLATSVRGFRHSISAITLQRISRLDSSELYSAPPLDDKYTLPRWSPKYAWNKGAPKQSLDRLDIQQIHTAKPWILNVIQAAHWSVALPWAWIGYLIVGHHDTWFSVVDQDHVRMSLLTFYPAVTFMGALFPIMSHDYDDWQLAPFRDASSTDKDLEYSANEYGNDRLHKLGDKMLFVFLSISSIMFYHGIMGFGPVLPLSLAMLLYNVLGDQNHLVSYYLSPPKGNDEPILPVPVCTSVFFVYSQILWVVALGTLIGRADVVVGADFTTGLWLLLGAAVSGQTLGGVYEGLVAESTFNQWDHLIAIGMLLAGFVAEAFLLDQFAKVL